jgi:hypothetical protein
MVRHRIPLSFLPARQFVGRNASPVAAAIKPLLVSNNTFGARKTTRDRHRMSCDAPDDNCRMKRDMGLPESEQVAIGAFGGNA